MSKPSGREHSLKFLLIRAVLIITIVVAVLIGLRVNQIGMLGDVPVEVIEEELVQSVE